MFHTLPIKKLSSYERRQIYGWIEIDPTYQLKSTPGSHNINDIKIDPPNFTQMETFPTPVIWTKMIALNRAFIVLKMTSKKF